MSQRHLDWPALRNARDLGGLPTSDGAVTSCRAVVRSDTLRQLTPAGWRSLADYGIGTVVDLRFQVEIDVNEPPASRQDGLSLARGLAGADGRPAALRTVSVPVLGEPDDALGAHLDRISRAQPDAAASTRAVYLELLGLFPVRFAAAVAAVAGAADGGVLVHCHAGKDRTGLVAALVLDVVGVQPDAIADDYASSGPNLASVLEEWIEDAPDEEERRLRRRIGSAPRQAMLDVLAELDACHGGAAGYLLAAGTSEVELERVRARLLE